MSIQVVIAQAQEEQRTVLAEQLEMAIGLKVVGETGNGVRALELVKQLKPDVLLCDVVLAGMDGCTLLEAVQRLPVKPAVIILSSVGRDDVICRAFELGAADYLLKPYDPDRLARRVMSAAAGVASRQHLLEQRLSGILLQLGIPAHVQGFRFLQEAIRTTVMDPSMVNQLMHRLYPHVASKCHSTPERVERSIRDAISIGWQRCRPEDIRRILSRSLSGGYEKPTSGELIALLAEHLRLNL